MHMFVEPRKKYLTNYYAGGTGHFSRESAAIDRAPTRFFSKCYTLSSLGANEVGLLDVGFE